MVGLAALLLSLAALAFSLHQQRLYEASADVLLNSQNAAATPPGTPSMGLSEDPNESRRHKPTSHASPKSCRTCCVGSAVPA